MADCPLKHQGQTMGDFVAELSRMAFVIGFPRELQYTSIHPLSGEFPRQVRLEIHGIHSYLHNMEVTACGGTFEHACEEASLKMMAHLRERHDGTLNTTAYRFHPRRGSSSNTSTFKSAWGENDVTFGHMSEVMEGYDKLHAMLHKATKRLNDQKLVRIAELQDENGRLKKEVARLHGCSPPGGARIRTMPRKSTIAPVRIQLAPRNPPPPPPPAPPAAPAPAPAPAPVPAPASALSFVPASAYRGPAGGSGGWLPASPSGGRVIISSSSSEAGSGDTYQLYMLIFFLQKYILDSRIIIKWKRIDIESDDKSIGRCRESDLYELAKNSELTR
nr:OSIGBa0137O04.5 [Oryza sativa]